MPVLRSFVVFVFVALAACSNERLDPETLRSLAAESDEMLARGATSQTFQKDEWPRTIAILTPNSVYARRDGLPIDGLYIVTGNLFVWEWGYFVPVNKSAFQPTSGSDPSFELVGEGVYAYEIKG